MVVDNSHSKAAHAEQMLALRAAVKDVPEFVSVQKEDLLALLANLRPSTTVGKIFASEGNVHHLPGTTEKISLDALLFSVQCFDIASHVLKVIDGNGDDILIVFSPLSATISETQEVLKQMSAAGGVEGTPIVQFLDMCLALLTGRVLLLHCI